MNIILAPTLKLLLDFVSKKLVPLIYKPVKVTIQIIPATRNITTAINALELF